VSSLKSWWPGVSSRLNTSPSCSNVITDEVTEMPRCCSIAIQSLAARRRSPRAFTSPGDVDRAAGQQQPLGQRRLAGIGVGDDRERAARGWPWPW
jgi:hypothetical protein